MIMDLAALFMCLMALIAIILLLVHMSKITYPERSEAKIKEIEVKSKIEKDSDPIPKIRALTDEYEADNEAIWRNQ